MVTQKCSITYYTTGCEAYPYTTVGYGIFNVRTNLGASRTHRRRARHKHVCTRVDSAEGREKLPLTLPRQGIETIQAIRLYDLTTLFDNVCIALIRPSWLTGPMGGRGDSIGRASTSRFNGFHDQRGSNPVRSTRKKL